MNIKNSLPINHNNVDNIIISNPYRVLGLPANSTEKELQKQIGIIKRYAEIGKSKTSDYDFEFIGNLTRNTDEVQQASNSIEQAPKKILYSLFWFVKNNQFDEIAFSNLKENQTEKAVDIWNKTLKDEITNKNYSSYLNLSTLYIALSTVENQLDLQLLQAGVLLKGNLIHSDYLHDFSKLVTGNGVQLDSIEMSKKFIDEVIELLKPFLNKINGISTNDLISLFNTFPLTVKKYISTKFTETPILSVENKIEKTKNNRKNLPSYADNYGQDLYKSTKVELVLIKQLLGPSSLQYQMLSDKVANEILQCSVDYFNESQEADEADIHFETDLSIAMTLTRIAKKIAISDQVKDKAVEDLNTLIEMKDRAIHQAIALLQSVKDAYSINESKIRRQVKIEEANLSYGQSINWSAVEEHIKNSINWDEVNNLLKTNLSNNNLKKIKESDNNKLKDQFLDLSNWLIRNSSRNSTILNIINKYKKIPPKLPFKILSSNVTNTDNKPFYTKFIRFIGLNLNIEVVKDASVTFYLKYIKPDGQTKCNSETSPRGYSLSEKIDLELNTSSISFSGWGNLNKCIYDIGEHQIEVYIDNHLIHRVGFMVELSPSEKLELDIEKLQRKLSKTQNIQYFKSQLHSLGNEISILREDILDIKNEQYFSSELRKLNNQLASIKEWKLFRGRETRVRQISEHQRQIEAIIEKGKLKKKQNILNIEEEIVLKRSEVKKVEEKAEVEKNREVSRIEEELLKKRKELNELINQ
ncbi:hypothetical protein [Lentimicrobium sp. S6]|uniref:hypothetical protein n=1 Tax=Lentimicrobium sp. S6 TaxID=2735872 RepID=UPI0015517E0E|nr:hypothetical protein [Lentimicrobium sp. S6]NPD47242.1 hypothetical protein [Lentimicrobium sp. S6]